MVITEYIVIGLVVPYSPWHSLEWPSCLKYLKSTIKLSFVQTNLNIVLKSNYICKTKLLPTETFRKDNCCYFVLKYQIRTKDPPRLSYYLSWYSHVFMAPVDQRPSPNSPDDDVQNAGPADDDGAVCRRVSRKSLCIFLHKQSLSADVVVLCTAQSYSIEPGWATEL